MENDIIKFLLGEDSFDGVWFGEKHPTEEGAFWWRKHLRQFHESQALRIHDVVGRSEQLPCGDLMKHNFSISKIGRCIPCDRVNEKAR